MNKLKIISFPEAKKKIERKSFWENVLLKFKQLFKKKTGFDKYKIFVWGRYGDTKRLYVEVQNLKTGKIKHHSLKTRGSHIDSENYEAVKLFVSKLK